MSHKAKKDGPEELPSGTHHFSSRQELKRKARRPAKRWEDDLNEFVKDEETEATQSNDLKNNDTWLTAAKKIYEWVKKEKRYTRDVIDDGGTQLLTTP